MITTKPKTTRIQQRMMPRSTLLAIIPGAWRIDKPPPPPKRSPYISMPHRPALSHARAPAAAAQAVAAAVEAKLASELTFQPKVNPSKGHRAQPLTLEVR